MACLKVSTVALVLASFVLSPSQSLSQAVIVASFAGAPFTTSAAELRAASAAIPASKEYGTQILYEEGRYLFAIDGTLAYRHRLIYRVDTDAAVKGWAEISSQWDPWNEKPAQLHARVLQPNGIFAELDQKTVTDTPVKGEDTETFSSERVRRAPLPGMAIGSVVEEEEVVDEKTPYFAGGGIYRFAFQENVPVARMRVTVEMPASMPFKKLLHNLPGLVPDEKEADGRRTVVLEKTALPPAHNSDIDLATNQPTTPLVEFATGASWGAIAKEYAAIADPQTVPAEAATILPKDLPVGRLEKVRAIVRQLHHEIRYTGVEFGAARLTPQRPSEVIARHYGDCKDKATLLVAMLRAASVKADLALLSTGPGRDVDSGLPGMNHFDHAIVYVPAAGPGKDDGEIWIDATAEHFAVGSIPYQDEGRQALVITSETTALTKTPMPRPEDSVLIETRTFKLAEFGPSEVEEISETQGYVDAQYRGDYGGAETPKMHEDMETYVKDAYLAKKLAKLERGDGADFDKPFKLTLVATGAKRGSTSLTDAAVATYPAGTTNTLPRWFSTKPPVLGPDSSTDERHEAELAEKSRPSTFAVRPYIYEEKVRILVPAGFIVRPMPTNKTTQLGQATLTERYSTAEAGVVAVNFRFNSGPSEITTEQALAMRDAMLELNKRDYVGIFFDQAGAKALTEGHIREALDVDRKLIAETPADALHHLQLARALLDAGIGSEAQSEARRATELDPRLATAFGTLGWTLEHNALGERFGKGFDLKAAVAAYRRAVELDPEDSDIRFDLAILYEFDARGMRYTADADVPAAIKSYKELIELNKDKGDQAIAQYRENMMYALLSSRQFAELDRMVASLPSTNAHRVFSITSATAQHGTAAGIAEADKGNVAQSDRNKNLRDAGTQLAGLHLYGEAAEMLSAGMQGGGDAASVARQVELYRGLKVASLAPLPKTDPAAPVQLGLLGIMSGTLTREQTLGMVSRHAYTSDAALERDVNKGLATVGFLRVVADKAGMSEAVMLDLIGGNTTFTAKGDDEHGYDMAAQIPGSEPEHTFVVKEDGLYRIVGDNSDAQQEGNYILWALEHGKQTLAKGLLDWKRDLMHKGGGDDAFSGPLLPRFWTVGSTKPSADSPEAMRLAAFAMIAGSMDAKPYLDEIAAAREKSSGQRQTDLDLLLAESAMGAEVPAIGMPAAKRLLEQEPDSEVALGLLGRGSELTGDAAGWQALLAPMLAKKPTDKDLLTQQMMAYELARDFKAAQAEEKKVLDTGKATANDYNNYAWLGLFHDDLVGARGEDIAKAAQQASQMSKNASFAELHTLACVDAAEGKTTEARQVLKEAMYAKSMVEPSSEVWYALGLIYEQYGAKAAAMDAYRKVQAHEYDDHTYVGPTATYVLAQGRLKELGS